MSKACKIMGYSRQQFYEIRRNFQTHGFQTHGAAGLIDRLPGARGPHPNRVPEEVEQAILDHALEHPSHGPLQVAHELTLKGLQVSSGGVRGVWSRHDSRPGHDRPSELLGGSTGGRGLHRMPFPMCYGPEFVAKDVHDWTGAVGAKTAYIELEQFHRNGVRFGVPFWGED